MSIDRNIKHDLQGSFYISTHAKLNWTRGESMKVLITGGLGFIGSRLARVLLQDGHNVRIIDCLLAQVHGNAAAVDQELASACDVRVEDIRNRDSVRKALSDVDAVVHLAAETGPAQSMYEIVRYTDTNVVGTSILLEEIIRCRKKIRRLVVASSRSVYGEGKYLCIECGPVFPDARSDERLRAGKWEPVCPACSSSVSLVATDEESLPKPTSIYAANKLSQEQMCLITGRAYNLPTAALRYQNVYGPGQSLQNPYIGVLAIFSSQIKSAQSIELYEDGAESRDFVNINDAVQATKLALECPLAGAEVFNVGSGQPTSLRDVARKLTTVMEATVPIRVTGRYRVGDIRHCYADLKKSAFLLGYAPKIDLESGLRSLSEWTENQKSFSSELHRATDELKNMGLFR